MNNDYALDPNDVQKFIEMFDEIHDSTSLYEDYGDDNLMSIAKLVGQLKDKVRVSSSENKIIPRRNLYDAFDEKAKELSEWRKEGRTDDTPYSIFKSILQVRYHSTDFIVSNNTDDETYSMVSGLIYYLGDVAGSVSDIPPEVKMDLYLSSRSKQEYEELCFYDLADFLIWCYF